MKLFCANIYKLTSQTFENSKHFLSRKIKSFSVFERLLCFGEQTLTWNLYAFHLCILCIGKSGPSIESLVMVAYIFNPGTYVTCFRYFLCIWENWIAGFRALSRVKVNIVEGDPTFTTLFTTVITSIRFPDSTHICDQYVYNCYISLDICVNPSVIQFNNNNNGRKS